MHKRKSELIKEHSCSPIPTIAVPIITQLPLFIGTSLVFREACAVPTPLDSESFLSLTSLAHTDTTGVLPIALGMLTFANVDAARLFQSDAQRAREAEEKRRAEEARAKGQTTIKPTRLIPAALRTASLARILLGLMVPGVCVFAKVHKSMLMLAGQGVLVYWVTSAAFGLLQTWGLDWWYRRKTNVLSRITVVGTPSKSTTKLPVTVTRPPIPFKHKKS
jgi:inner membrane protein COX18